MFNVRFSLLFCVVYVFSGFSLKAQDVKVSYEAMGKNYILKAENSSFYPYTIQIVFTKLTGASGMTTDVPYISVAGNKEVYDSINELEYHDNSIYANVWQKPIILKINPKTGEVVGKFDFSAIVKKHITNEDDVLNGIAFKGENMLITGKNWDKIYEVKIK